MRVLLLSGDLMTQSKINSVTQSLGLTTIPASSVARLFEAARETSIVVLDLAIQSYELADVVAQLRSLHVPPRAVLAFGPHVHRARLQSAVDAGCDAVFSRGQFLEHTAEILRRFVEGGSSVRGVVEVPPRGAELPAGEPTEGGTNGMG